MTRAIALTLHGLRHENATIAGQTPAEDRYTLTVPRFRFLVGRLAQQTCCTVHEALGLSGGDPRVLTFDDGLISDYELAFPELAQRGIRATFFVTAEQVGRPGYMSPPQLRELAARGMEIGSHGLRHRYLVTLPPAEAEAEIAASRERLQQLLGAPVLSYAPVGGHFVPWMLDRARQAGYRAFASMIPGRTVIEQDQAITLFQRNHLQSHHGEGYIEALVAGNDRLLLSNRLRYHLLALPKRVLGMQRYDRLKEIVFTRGGEAA